MLNSKGTSKRVLIVLVCSLVFPGHEAIAQTTESSAPTTYKEILALPREESDAALDRLFRTADEAKRQALLREAWNYEDQNVRPALLRSTLLVYVDIDPEGALSHVRSLDEPASTELEQLVFWQWARKDLDAAVSEAGKMHDSPRMEGIRTLILSTQAQAGPRAQAALYVKLGGNPDDVNVEKMFEAATSETDPRRRGRALSRFGMTAGSFDHLAGLEMAERLTSSVERNSVRAAVLQGYARSYPKEAMQVMDDLARNEEKWNMSQVAISTLAMTDLDSALEVALSLSTHHLREGAVTSVLSTWSLEDLDGAKRAYLAIPDRDSHAKAGSMILKQLVGRDPVAALVWAEEADGVGSDLWHSAVLSVAAVDTGAALQAANSLGSQQARVKLLERLATSLGNSQPSVGAEIVESMPDGSIKARSATGLFRNWTRQDFDSAWDWLMEQPSDLIDEVLSGTADTLARTHLQFMLAVPSNSVPKNIRKKWVDAVVGEHGMENPDETLGWLEQFSEEAHYETWIGLLAGYKVGRDLHAALELIETIEGQLAYESAVGNIARHWSALDAEAAASWVEGLTRVRARGPYVLSVAAKWCKYDYARCLEWVRSIEPYGDRDVGLFGVMMNTPLEAEALSPLLNLIVDENKKAETRWKLINMAYRERGIEGADALMLDLQVDEVERQKYLDRLRAFAH